jgi:hypothetical protein
MHQPAIKDAIAALNTATTSLLKLYDLPPTDPQCDDLIAAVGREMDEVRGILTTIKRLSKGTP